MNIVLLLIIVKVGKKLHNADILSHLGLPYCSLMQHLFRFYYILLVNKLKIRKRKVGSHLLHNTKMVNQ